MLSQFQINFIKQVQQQPDFDHFPAHWLEDVDAYALQHAEDSSKQFPISVAYYSCDRVLRVYRVGVRGVLGECAAQEGRLL